MIIISPTAVPAIQPIPHSRYPSRTVMIGTRDEIKYSGCYIGLARPRTEVEENATMWKKIYNMTHARLLTYPRS